MTNVDIAAENYIEDPSIYGSTVNMDMRYNRPQGVLMNNRGIRFFQAPTRLLFDRDSEEELAENQLGTERRYYIISKKTFLFYEIIQEKPGVSKWIILEPAEPIEVSEGKIYYQNSQGKWHKLKQETDSNGNLLLEPAIDLIEA